MALDFSSSISTEFLSTYSSLATNYASISCLEAFACTRSAHLLIWHIRAIYNYAVALNLLANLHVGQAPRVLCNSTSFPSVLSRELSDISVIE